MSYDASILVGNWVNDNFINREKAKVTKALLQAQQGTDGLWT